DYRYFPDPDLLPLVIDEAWIETVRQSLPELPDPRRRRYVEDFGLPDYDAEVLTSARELADYFEACVGAGAAAKPAANWIMGSLLGLLKAENRDFDQIPVPAPALAELLRLIDEGTISGKIAKTVFDEMAASGRTAAAIVAERGLVQISDAGQIGAVVDRILAANAGQVEAYRSGKTKIFGFFVGQVMRETRGKANPKVVNDLLREKLGAG
ncbi:MAG: Asp-tRNA(Asn)/Glu-tRNA(Gln) amidotransferase GatCAB subunit B, partial [Deltaproteobacteria bacterium]